MNEYVQITTTTGTRHDAEQIAAELVSRRLAGCAQVTRSFTSTFRWQDKVETAEEWMSTCWREYKVETAAGGMCMVKTSRAQLGAIQKVFEAIQSYYVPELIAVP